MIGAVGPKLELPTKGPLGVSSASDGGRERVLRLGAPNVRLGAVVLTLGTNVPKVPNCPVGSPAEKPITEPTSTTVWPVWPTIERIPSPINAAHSVP